VFLKGCPLRCAWCQNPESQDPAPQLLIFSHLCMDCGLCRQVCPEMGHDLEIGPSSPDELRPVYRPSHCRVCGRCVDVCPTGARQIAGQEMTVDEIASLALRDRPFYGERGGVTLSGGEPLAQWPVARALADRLRAEGVHVALDTSCLAPGPVIAEVSDHVDLVLADLKAVTPDLHRRWAGVANAGILAAIRVWSTSMPGRLWISVPLIPAVQDGAELERIATFCTTLNHSPPVRLIPYHRLGDGKYAALGWPVPAFVGSVEEQVDLATRVFVQRGVRILEQP
jgi:pyruvate formate lyase activating enzyme